MKKLTKLLMIGLLVASIGSFSAKAETTNSLQSFSVNPGESLDFESDVMTAQGQFTGVIIAYHQEQSSDDFVEFQMRFKDGLKFTEWVDIHADGDHSHAEDDHGETQDMLINTNLTNKYQYRVNVKSGLDSKGVKLNQLKFTFINAKEGKTVDTVVKNQELLAGFETSTASRASVISRSGWGANDELNYYAKGQEPDSGADIDADDSNDEIAKVISTENGKTLKWPYQYAKTIRTIVVHHTASTNDLNNPKQAIRNIQYYHAVNRGWGDIGYNYIIDQDGKIYEGRKGGEKVIGGHAVPVNKTSIGIAVLGNYEEQQVPGKVIESLVKISSEKASIYGLNLTGKFNYKDKTYNVLQGHKDNSATACPGANLYAALPSLRYIASNGGGVSIHSLNNKPLAFLDANPLRDIVEMEAFDSETIEVKIKNVGKQTWSKNTTFLRSASYDQYSDLDISSVTKMNESTVAPGGNATFKIDVNSGLLPGYKGLKFVASLNGEVQESYPIYAPIFVEEPNLSFSVQSGDAENLKLNAGEKKTLKFKIKNTGDIDWNLNGYQTVLAVKSGDSNLLTSEIKVGSSKVRSNSTVDVSVPITAPNKSGKYKIELAPFIKNIGWFDGESLILNVEVSGNASPLSSAKKRYLQSDGKLKVAVKETNTLSFEIKNNSNETWTNASFGIAVLGGRRGLGTNDFSNKLIANEPVKPGQVAEINMDIFPRAYSSFDYKLRVFANGKLLNRNGIDLSVVGSANLQNSNSKPIRFDSTTVGSTSNNTTVATLASVSNDPGNSSDYGPDIRIHLSNFNQNSVTVTGTGLTLKVDGVSKSNGSSVKIEKSGAKVKATSSGNTVSGNIIRIENDGIITLDGYENRPAWDTSLNDNLFRETIEFRIVDGKLAAINELPMELYLRGLAEVSNTTDSEKIKTIMVAARSYAYHYITDDEKFPGKPWNLDDSPARSQKYLGYGFEKRAPNVKNALIETAGKVVTYNNQVIKVPYFSQSDGRTRSAKEVWGWNNTPYLAGVDDPYCSGKSLLGHGVGISGCGSDAMAKAGYDHEDIIKYYLKGVGFKYVYARN